MWSNGWSGYELHPGPFPSKLAPQSEWKGTLVNPDETLRALAELAQNRQQPVPSPCISICRMDPDNGLCLGCWRDIDEIITWGRLDEDGKRVVWQAITERLAAQPR